jgi:Spy/CpxP family protein refolding chaperone
MNSSKKTAIVATVALALAGSGATALAQFGQAAGIAEAMVPDFMTRDVRLFQDGLNLDDTQRVIIEALFYDYQDSFDAGLQQMKQRFEEMRPELQALDERRVMAMVFVPFEEWGQQKAVLREQFLENTRVLLTPEQLELWPAFDRRLFREKEIHKGILAGESTDLLAIVRDLHLDEESMRSVRPTLDAYDIALDLALRARQESITGRQSEMLQHIASDNLDLSMAIFERQLARRVGIRNVNDEYTIKIAEVLPEGTGAKFKAIALDRAYPRVYRETPVERLFRAALELEGLDPAIRASVDQVMQSYLIELSAMNEALVQAVRKQEPIEQRLRAQAFTVRMAGNQPEKIEDPTREDFVRRDDLGKDYVKQLQALLTPEQFGGLPGAGRFVNLNEVNAGTPKAMPLRASDKGSRTASPSSTGSGAKGP